MWRDWLIGAGIGALVGLLIGIGQFLSGLGRSRGAKPSADQELARSTAAARSSGESTTTQVKVFALSTCPYSRKAREFLDESGVAYNVIEVDKLEGAAKDATVGEVQRLSGETSLPVIVVGDQVVVGFEKARIARLVGL